MLQKLILSFFDSRKWAVAFTADATGLQTFPEYYKEGLSLGTYRNGDGTVFPTRRTIR